ncbi:protein FAM149A [Pithys albifrons albifrons]|uniref:protein FAM149A n=1 Tax=Pithys albifrons albifrons TaxID=3385563 RepID=UPI003A5CFC74
MRGLRDPGPPGGSGSGGGLLVVGKGLSRDSTNRCLSGKSGESLPSVFAKNVQKAIDNYTCETLSSLSSSGCTTPTELSNSWSGINSYTTGLSSEESSVYSWRDDMMQRGCTCYGG